MVSRAVDQTIRVGNLEPEVETVRPLAAVFCAEDGHWVIGSKVGYDSDIELVTVRINSTESQLTMLAAQRGLLRARVLRDAGERLVAQVDELLEGNRKVVQDNPVRSVSELLTTTNAKSEQRPNLDAARKFLVAKVKVELPATERTVETTVEIPVIVKGRPVQEQASGKPIFAQD